MVNNINSTINVEKVLEKIIGCKWSIHILRLVAKNYNRPSMILRLSPGLSAKVMNERLHTLCNLGVLKRVVYGEKPPIKVEYHFTDMGQSFLRIIKDIEYLEEKLKRK